MKSEDCLPKHCVKDPIPFDCGDYCIKILVQAATVEEKVLILGFHVTTAQAIFNTFNFDKNVRTFDDLAVRLSDAQVSEIRTRFNQTTPAQRAYFQLDKTTRQAIIDAIKALPWNPGEYDVL